MAFPDWSSLPAELTSRIADCFLATSDVDYYMVFRAVCHSWRAATVDPKNSPDPRFRPSHWVMIDNKVYGRRCSARRLFVNTITGRFLRKKLQLLHNYFITTATSDGLLILMDKHSPQALSVLNPFTGYFVRFTALPPDMEYEDVESAALVSCSSPNLILVCTIYMIDDKEDYNDIHIPFRCPTSSRKVYMADPDSESFAVYEDKGARPLIRLAVRGIYTNGDLGSVVPFPFHVAKRMLDLIRGFYADPADMSDDEDTMTFDEDARYDKCFHLVASAGGVLIIFKLKNGMEVYRMDTDRYILEHVDNIDNRAIFLGDYGRCMSVNADKIPSIDANCIYFIKRTHLSYDICMYNIMHRREERIYKSIPLHSAPPYGSTPYTIIQHLCHGLRGF